MPSTDGLRISSLSLPTRRRPSPLSVWRTRWLVPMGLRTSLILIGSDIARVAPSIVARPALKLTALLTVASKSPDSSLAARATPQSVLSSLKQRLDAWGQARECERYPAG